MGNHNAVTAGRSIKRLKWRVNLWPPYLASGIRLSHVSEDLREVDVRMRLRWFNRNLVGSHFGGSLYSMTDPWLMIMLIHNLGRDYLVWDKSAHIEYVKPGTTEVAVKFHLTDNDIHEIVTRSKDGQAHYMQFNVNVVDTQGDVVAKVGKTLYIRLKKHTRPKTATD